jgi:hypothetical protein
MEGQNILHKDFSFMQEDVIFFADESDIKITNNTKLWNITDMKTQRTKKIFKYLAFFVTAYIICTLLFGEKQVTRDEYELYYEENGGFAFRNSWGVFHAVYKEDGNAYYKDSVGFFIFFIIFCAYPLFGILMNLIEILFNDKKLEDDKGLLEISKNKLRVYVHFKEEFDIDNLISTFETKKLTDELKK